MKVRSRQYHEARRALRETPVVSLTDEGLRPFFPVTSRDVVTGETEQFATPFELWSSYEWFEVDGRATMNVYWTSNAPPGTYRLLVRTTTNSNEISDDYPSPTFKILLG